MEDTKAPAAAQAQSHPLEDVSLNGNDDDKQTPKNWVKFDDEADSGEKNNNSNDGDATQQQQQQNKLTLPPPPSVVSSNNNRRARSRSPSATVTTTTPVQVTYSLSPSSHFSHSLSVPLTPLRPLANATKRIPMQVRPLLALSLAHPFDGTANTRISRMLWF